MQSDEEKDIWQQFRQSGDTLSRDRLFDKYKSWADTEASWIYRQLSVNGIEAMDFRQLAYQGMLEAIERFDPEQNVTFKAFAVHRIRGAIFSALPQMSESSSFYAKRGKYLQSNNGDPNSKETAKDRGEPISQLVAMVMSMAVEFLLQEPEADLTQLTGEFYSSPEINTIAQRIRDHVESLTEPMRSVVSLHYYDELSFDKISQMLDLSNSRISQLHKKAIGELKARIGW